MNFLKYFEKIRNFITKAVSFLVQWCYNNPVADGIEYDDKAAFIGGNLQTLPIIVELQEIETFRNKNISDFVYLC
jgi:hypothetical protein